MLEIGRTAIALEEQELMKWYLVAALLLALAFVLKAWFTRKVGESLKEEGCLCP